MRTITTLTILLNLLFISYSATYGQQAKPFFKEKSVIALNNPLLNYSADMAYLKGMRYKTLGGRPEEDAKGRYRTQLPEISLMLNPMLTEDAVINEILTAKEMGVDVFMFPIFVSVNRYYTDKFIKTITEYVNAADKHNLDFHFTIQLRLQRNPKQTTEEEMKQVIVKRLNQLFKNTKYSSKWLRNVDDEMIIFTTETADLVDGTKRLKANDYLEKPELVTKIKETLDEVEATTGTECAFIYESKYPFNYRYNTLLLDHFPALSQNKYSMGYRNGVASLRKICKRLKKPFIQNVFPDQLSTQMVLKEGEKKIQENSAFSKTLKYDDVFVRTQPLKLTSAYREFLEDAVNHDAAAINLSSWNYYDEGSHIAPEAHHGYGYGLLLKYYKKLWLNNGQANVDKELVMTSYKAYSTQFLEQTNIHIKYGIKYFEEASEDSIEVISILKEPADVYCNGGYLGTAPAGLTTFYAERKLGNVEIVVKRKSKQVIKYTTPKELIDYPERMDWLTYTFTNLDEEMGIHLQNIALNYEMRQMYQRFLVSPEKQNFWVKAQNKRYLAKKKAYYEYGMNPDKFFAVEEKIDKKYQEEIKKILDDFQYEVWLEMEESAATNVGVANMFQPTKKDIMDGYNVLQVDDI